MRVKRDGENASVVDGYGGEEVEYGTDGCVSEGRRTTKGKDSAASHLPRAEVEDKTPDSRLNRGQCAVGLESTRFESWFAETTENRWTGQMDQTGQSRGQNTWLLELIGVSSCWDEIHWRLTWRRRIIQDTRTASEEYKIDESSRLTPRLTIGVPREMPQPWAGGAVWVAAQAAITAGRASRTLGLAGAVQLGSSSSILPLFSPSL